MSTLAFVRSNLRWLFAGAMLAFLSAFGQTFFISIFAGEIREEFSLSHGEWGGIYMIGTALSALVMIWAGGLADKYRVRLLGSVVLVLLALACVFMSFNTQVVLLVIAIFFLRFFGQGMSAHIAGVGMTRWFSSNRGKALAFATMGFALAEATMPLSFAALKTFVDWRSLWIVAAVVCVLAVPLLSALLYKERTPQSIATETATTGMDNHHWTRNEAIRHPLFWSLVPAILFMPAFGTAFWFQQVHFAEIKGWEHLQLVAVFPLGTFTLLLSTLVFGWLLDRFGTAPLLPIYLLPYAAAFTVHSFAPSLAFTALGVVLMGMSGGGQATLILACWAEFFGTKHIGSIKASAAAVGVLGSALGPGLSGWLIDTGIDLEVQYLFYAASFVFASLVTILPLRAAKSRLAPPSQIHIERA